MEKRSDIFVPLCACEEGFDFVEFFGADAFGGDGAEDEFHGGAGEAALDEIVDELELGVVLRVGGAENLGALGVIFEEETFFDHHLDHFEGGGVTGVAVGFEGVVDLPDGGGAAGPEDLEDGEFDFGGDGGGLSGHF